MANNSRPVGTFKNLEVEQGLAIVCLFLCSVVLLSNSKKYGGGDGGGQCSLTMTLKIDLANQILIYTEIYKYKMISINTLMESK